MENVLKRIQKVTMSVVHFQLLLLQESWKDLFLLHLSQWAVPWDLSNLLNTRQNSLRTNGHILPIEEEVFDMEVKTMQVMIFRIVLPDCRTRNKSNSS